MNVLKLKVTLSNNIVHVHVFFVKKYMYFSIHQVYCYLEFYLEMKGEGREGKRWKDRQKSLWTENINKNIQLIKAS